MKFRRQTNKRTNINKLLKITTVFLAIFIALSSCKKDVTNTTTNTTTNDDYYVKYVIEGKGPYTYFSDFSVNTDQENVSFSGYQYQSWNQTYGPVKNGFKAFVSVEGESPYVTVEIYVSKNNGPFALKASKSGDNLPTSNLSQSYIINF